MAADAAVHVHRRRAGVCGVRRAGAQPARRAVRVPLLPPGGGAPALVEAALLPGVRGFGRLPWLVPILPDSRMEAKVQNPTEQEEVVYFYLTFSYPPPFLVTSLLVPILQFYFY